MHVLPDPVMGDDGHYLPFDELYGVVDTTEKDLPTGSLIHKKETIQCNVTEQHVKNVNLVVECEECHMWRLLLSKRKLSPQSIAKLLDDMQYTCGATIL